MYRDTQKTYETLQPMGKSFKRVFFHVYAILIIMKLTCVYERVKRRNKYYAYQFVQYVKEKTKHPYLFQYKLL